MPKRVLRLTCHGYALPDFSVDLRLKPPCNSNHDDGGNQYKQQGGCGAENRRNGCPAAAYRRGWRRGWCLCGGGGGQATPRGWTTQERGRRQFVGLFLFLLLLSLAWYASWRPFAMKASMRNGGLKKQRNRVGAAAPGPRQQQPPLVGASGNQHPVAAAATGHAGGDSCRKHKEVHAKSRNAGDSRNGGSASGGVTRPSCTERSS